MGSKKNKKINWVLIVILTIFILYGGIKILPFISGPEIKIEKVKNGGTTEKILSLKGQVKKTKELKINNEIIPFDENGQFSEIFILESGYNWIELIAYGHGGYQKKKSYEIFYNEPVKTESVENIL